MANKLMPPASTGALVFPQAIVERKLFKQRIGDIFDQAKILDVMYIGRIVI